jgi:low temperature requirement protein LtrA
MKALVDKSRMLRLRVAGERTPVTTVELFFDLVFVFAITQLSHSLLHHLSLAGALQTLLLLLAVWWVWVDTSWVTNWLDPQTTAVRVMLFVLMLLGLVLSASIPRAFEDRALWFAVAYAAMQLGRSLFTMWALRGNHQGNYRNFRRIACWHGLTSALWVAGALIGGELRAVIWTAAMAIEFTAPVAGFWTPWLGRSTTADWDVAGDHMAERCGLFVILALGESILITGANFAELAWDAWTVISFAIGLVGSIAMWWVYFNIGAERAERMIEHSTDPGRIARLAYTYLHIIIVAGIIVCAVADELVLRHPQLGVTMTARLVLAGGPALFLLGCLLFKWVTAGWPPLSHQVGLGLTAVLIVPLFGLSQIALGGLSTLVLVVVAIWESISLGGVDGSGHRGDVQAANDA